MAALRKAIYCSEPEEEPAGEFDRDSDGEDATAGGAPGVSGKYSVYAAPPVVAKKAQHKHKKIKVGARSTQPSVPFSSIPRMVVTVTSAHIFTGNTITAVGCLG